MGTVVNETFTKTLRNDCFDIGKSSGSLRMEKVEVVRRHGNTNAGVPFVLVHINEHDADLVRSEEIYVDETVVRERFSMSMHTWLCFYSFRGTLQDVVDIRE